VIDGTSGAVVLDPRPRTLARYRRKVDRGSRVRLRERWLRNRPVTTRDGRQIDILASIGTSDDSLLARTYGAAGIGLFRIENLYLAADSLPSEEELSRQILEAIAPLRGKPITIRLLDVGGDKRLPYLDLPPEGNPFLGRRGIRLLLQYPELLRSELRALLAVHRECPIQILVPMVTFPEEVRRVKDTLREVARECGVHRIPKVGAMIEIPAAALCASAIAEESDFLSIGTNDLAQYTMAADRDNPHVAEYYRSDHDAVLALVRLTVEQTGGKAVCVCGDIASDPDALPALLSTGVRCLSVVPSALAEVKSRIRGIAEPAPGRPLDLDQPPEAPQPS
jgi:phosphoenolpyruvate-protein kinase (PTS system EI component)